MLIWLVVGVEETGVELTDNESLIESSGTNVVD
jgi:hypothetical protein